MSRLLNNSVSDHHYFNERDWKILQHVKKKIKVEVMSGNIAE